MSVGLLAVVDDILSAAVKASAKTAGVVIDDAAVTPQYVQGVTPARELPIVGKIAIGSLINKFVIIIPIALLLTAFAPWVLPWLSSWAAPTSASKARRRSWSGSARTTAQVRMTRGTSASSSSGRSAPTSS